MNLPEFQTLKVTTEHGVLLVQLNRPEVRNAMSLAMVHELIQVMDLAAEYSLRAVVLRGEQGHFCAGGDVQDMVKARMQAADATQADPYAALNRAFGRLLQKAEHLPCVLIVVLEGAVLGGGLGLTAVSDVAIAHHQAKFGLPETGLGLIPAQIAPFLVRRMGLTTTRRLALLGLRFDADEARRCGLIHEVAATDEDLQSLLEQTLQKVRQCAPQANRVTKQLLLSSPHEAELDGWLDRAAQHFSEAVRGAEGMEGTMAFMQKRPASWTQA
ncbi:MAG: enoyl-CoA hydratase/isomerase family protein [Pseudomonadales bacterium]|nr:enoyl-CoA hydratase/isomerase family protein [Pseudomonadales bacterium]